MRVEAEGMSDDAWSRFDKVKEPGRDLHKFVLPEHNTGANFSGTGSLDGERVKQILPGSSDYHAIAKTDSSIEVTAGVSWGGNQPPKAELTITGSVSNSRSYGTIEYKIDNNGRQELNTTGGQNSDDSVDSADHSASQDQR